MTESKTTFRKPSTDDLIAFNQLIRCSEDVCDFKINGVPVKLSNPLKPIGVVGIGTWGPND
jgi:hypothetical protein